MKAEKLQKVIHVLTNVLEYMEERSDVDEGHFDEGGTWHDSPNEEMRFVTEINEILPALKRDLEIRTTIEEVADNLSKKHSKQ